MSRIAPSRVRASALLVCVALGGLASPAARAVIASCTVAATGVVFGIYTPLQAAPLASTGTISIACIGVFGRNTVTVDLSTGASGNYATRTLQSGTFNLNYNLYLDPANTQIWGNGTGGSVEGTASIRRRRRNATLTVYGAAAARQDPAAGGYTDTITVTVNY
jgi:spore coat protein U-like protein